MSVTVAVKLHVSSSPTAAGNSARSFTSATACPPPPEAVCTASPFFAVIVHASPFSALPFTRTSVTLARSVTHTYPPRSLA